MKLITKLSMAFVFIIIGVTVYSQECNFYMPLVENKGAVYKSYDANDNLEGSQEIKIKKVVTHPDFIEAIISSKHHDARDRLLYGGEFGVNCIGDEIVIDFQSILDPSMMEGFDDMEVRMESSNIVVPANLSVGRQLPDASANFKVVAGGMIVTEMTFSLKDRKVLAKERISVPAGNFDTYKLGYDFIVETKAMGMDSIMTYKYIEYHSTDVGMVRSETYDKEGKMIDYTVLSEIL